MESMRWSLLFVYALMAGGCDCGNGSDAIAEIGTGTTSFELLEDGQDLELIAGQQGGYHFIVNASMAGIEPGTPSMPGLLSNPATSFGIFSEAGDRLDAQFPPYRLGYRERTDGSAMFQLPSGRILALADGVDPETLYDQRVELRVEIREEDGPRANDEVFIVAREGEPLPMVDAGPIDAGTDASSAAP